MFVSSTSPKRSVLGPCLFLLRRNCPQQVSNHATTTTTTTTTRRQLSSKTAAKARVVVVGSGRMGHIRASLLRANPRFEVHGIVDQEMTRAQALADQYSVSACLILVLFLERYYSLLDSLSLLSIQLPAYSSLEEALDPTVTATQQQPLDGIVLSTPTFTHGELIRQAADANLSVFVEKPVDETAYQIESLFDYCRNQRGIHLCCGFQRRFDPSYVAAQEAVQSGQIGKPVVANIFFADHPCPPKEFLLTGGNIFYDLSAHDVDYITATLQDEIVSVYATGTSSDAELQAAGVHDNATMVMTTEKGMYAQAAQACPSFRPNLSSIA